MTVPMMYEMEDAWLQLARLTWYETIQNIKKKYPEYKVTSMYFNKISALTYFRLKKQGIDFKFPYSWYLFGTEAEMTGRDVDYPSDEESHRTNVDWKGRNLDEFRQDPTANAIREMIYQLISEYPPDLAERAVDEIYDNAPYEFQRKYRLVRIKIATTGRGSRYEDELRSKNLGQLIENAFDDFPGSGFDIPRQYCELVRVLLDRMTRPTPAGTFALLSEVIEEFWGFFCTYLRLDPEGNAHVDHRILDLWEEYAEKKSESFQRNIGDIVVELCNSAHYLKQEDVISPIYEKRSKEQLEEAAIIDEMAEVFEDIDTTLAQLYGKPARR